MVNGELGFPGDTVAKNPLANAGDARQRVRKIPWRRKWQSTLVFLRGKFQGQRSLEGYSPWGCKIRHDSATEHTRKW